MKIEYTKSFIGDLLKGLSITEQMKFVDLNHAKEWIKVAEKGVTKPCGGSAYRISNVSYINS